MLPTTQAQWINTHIQYSQRTSITTIKHTPLLLTSRRIQRSYFEIAWQSLLVTWKIELIRETVRLTKNLKVALPLDLAVDLDSGRLRPILIGVLLVVAAEDSSWDALFVESDHREWRPAAGREVTESQAGRERRRRPEATSSHSL